MSLQLSITALLKILFTIVHFCVTIPICQVTVNEIVVASHKSCVKHVVCGHHVNHCYHFLFI